MNRFRVLKSFMFLVNKNMQPFSCVNVLLKCENGIFVGCESVCQIVETNLYVPQHPIFCIYVNRSKNHSLIHRYTLQEIISCFSQRWCSILYIITHSIISPIVLLNVFLNVSPKRFSKYFPQTFS